MWNSGFLRAFFILVYWVGVLFYRFLGFEVRCFLRGKDCGWGYVLFLLEKFYRDVLEFMVLVLFCGIL